MAADLHIHVRTPELTDDIMRMFFSSTIGDSKWCIPFPDSEDEETVKDQMTEWWEAGNRLKKARAEWEEAHGKDLYELFLESPNIWIGEVSWLKAALFEDGEAFIPSVVEKVFELTDGKIIDDKMINDVKEAFKLPNSTGYSIANVDEVISFLIIYKGQEAFTISW